MQSFIPHKDNPHKIRRFLGVIFVIAISLMSVYFIQKYDYSESKTNAKVSEQVQEQQVNAVMPPDKETLEAAEKLDEQKEQQVVEIADSDKMATTIEEAMAEIPAAPRSKDPLVALTEAKIFAKPQIKEGKYIDISLSHQNMVLFEDGKFVDSYLISSGKKGMDTPIGTFQIQNKVTRAWSNKYKLFMPYWMAIVPSGEYGIHQLPEWPGGYREGANHLGIPVSHGCVRLGVGPAKRVYEWTEVGTTVIIHK